MKQAIASAAVQAAVFGIIIAAVLAWPSIEAARVLRSGRWWLESPDAQGIVANLAVVTRHADTSLDKADAVSDAAQRSASESVSTQRAFADAIRRTDASLNDAKLGVLPNARDGIYITTKDAHQVLEQAREALELVQNQTIELASAGTATLNESTVAMHNLAELLGDKHLHDTLVNIDKATGAFAAAGTSVEAILEDLRHPEKPGKFVRALSIMLTILRGTSLAGQSAPVFGR